LKKLIILFIAALFTVSSVGICFAGPDGNKRKGKYTYRKVYKACHERGEVDQAKPPISPDEKTQAQWDRVFEGKKFEEFGCKQEWDALEDKELMDIYTYLHAHAADSPTPAKCK